MSITTIPDNSIADISTWLDGPDLRHFGYTCLRYYKFLHDTDPNKSRWLRFQIQEFEKRYATYFQKVPQILNPNYPLLSELYNSYRDSDGFLPDFDLEGEGFWGNFIGQNSIKWFLHESNQQYKNNPQRLYCEYRKAERKILELSGKANPLKNRCYHIAFLANAASVGIVFVSFCAMTLSKKF